MSYCRSGARLPPHPPTDTLGYVEDPGELNWGISSTLDFETLINNGFGQVERRLLEYQQEGPHPEERKDGEFEYTYSADGRLQQIQEIGHSPMIQPRAAGAAT